MGYFLDAARHVGVARQRRIRQKECRGRGAWVAQETAEMPCEVAGIRVFTAEQGPLFGACDEALQATVALLHPRYVVGVGAFASERAAALCRGLALRSAPSFARAPPARSPTVAGPPRPGASWPRWLFGSTRGEAGREGKMLE